MSLLLGVDSSTLRYDLLLSILVLCLSAYLFTSRWMKQSRLPLPPGPKGIPILGNLPDIPKTFEWIKFHEWSKEFDTDILHLNIAGMTFIVLDTVEAATELLERRSSNYSGRPRMPMIKELMGWTFILGFMDYGDRWRKHRRLMHQAFHPTAARKFHPHEVKATRNMLLRCLGDSGDMMANLRHLAGETILSIAYGIDVKPKDDPYVTLAEQAIHPLVVAAVPGTYLVDTFPVLKYIPEWVPGARFQKVARASRIQARRMIETPFSVVKREMASGKHRTSFTSISLQKMDEGVRDDAYQEGIIRNIAGTMYTAGSDTTVSAMASCVLGLLEHPEILKKAQAEIDSVLKPGHLPDFDDQPSLPYITAIVKETLRWRDAVPMAVPHTTTVEDEYKGYRIPAGSLVIPNAWAMLHNEDIYPEPFKFNPDRFMKDGKLDTSVRDPAHACWGFGRRICPARFMAFDSVWLVVASLIAVFDIKKAVDENGNVIEPDQEYISAMILMPKPFKCQITPRSKEAEALIRRSSQQDA